MLNTLLAYFLLCALVLSVLSYMILRIGKMLSDCPERGAIIRAASVTVATGFAAIGAGAVILLGLALPLAGEVHLLALPAALGLSILGLGLGFTHAIGTLRLVASGPERGVPEETDAAPKDATV